MMFSSNQSFTICGETDEALAKVLQLAIELDGGSMYEAYYDDDNGLCFCSIGIDKADSDEEDEGITNYAPAPTVNSLVEHIKQWLASYFGTTRDIFAIKSFQFRLGSHVQIYYS